MNCSHTVPPSFSPTPNWQKGSFLFKSPSPYLYLKPRPRGSDEESRTRGQLWGCWANRIRQEEQESHVLDRHYGNTQEISPLLLRIHSDVNATRDLTLQPGWECRSQNLHSADKFALHSLLHGLDSCIMHVLTARVAYFQPLWFMIAFWAIFSRELETSCVWNEEKQMELNVSLLVATLIVHWSDECRCRVADLRSLACISCAESHRFLPGRCCPGWF